MKEGIGISREIFPEKMGKSKKDWIDTIRLVTSLIALTVTVMGAIKKFMDWSESKSSPY